MDMLKYKRIVAEGDLVIVYLDVRHMYPLTVKREEVFQSRYGALKHNDVIGRPFGSCVSCTRGWVYVLFPTPELWTVTLPHRTQILYAADISLIVLQLDLKPGAVVCEAGTGSGSLTHALARAVYPSGRVLTFDFHAARVLVAQEEFVAHGLVDVAVRERDVCRDGFGVAAEADAISLDLPEPWEAVSHAARAIKPSGGRLCSFSPCIEQVQRTCLALEASGFRDIVTVECLQKVYEVKKRTQAPAASEENEDCPAIPHWSAVPPLQTAGHTGYLTYASFGCSEARDPVKELSIGS